MMCGSLPFDVHAAVGVSWPSPCQAHPQGIDAVKKGGAQQQRARVRQVIELAFDDVVVEMPVVCLEKDIRSVWQPHQVTEHLMRELISMWPVVQMRE
eukprot:scaffold20320_cov51-Prasinocladus_malaysianus.AAC.1